MSFRKSAKLLICLNRFMKTNKFKKDEDFEEKIVEEEQPEMTKSELEQYLKTLSL